MGMGGICVGGGDDVGVNGREGSGDDGGGGEEGGGEEGGRGAGADQVDPDAAVCDELWRRDDRASWSDELVRAHAALELGRGWGIAWAKLVARFYDFEAKWGFAEGTWQMGSAHRPPQVATWLSRRKWTMGPTIGSDIGTRATPELWVGRWWRWWESLQPVDRVLFLDDKMQRPETADWSEMATMHGNNGLLQVIATLFWWGERVEGRRRPRDPEQWNDFMEAVDDVTWVLDQLLESGDIGRSVIPGLLRYEEDSPNGKQCTRHQRLGGGWRKENKAEQGKVGPDRDRMSTG
jgi:hypothetical protein